MNQIDGCISTLYQSIGIGGLKPNTVMINWPKSVEHSNIFAGSNFFSFVS